MSRLAGIGVAFVLAAVLPFGCSSGAADGVARVADEANAPTTGAGGGGPFDEGPLGGGNGPPQAGGQPGTHRSDQEPTGAEPASKDILVAPGCKEIASSFGTSPRTYFESADDSNSMGSPVLARQMLRDGMAPDPSGIRTYEFLNYYHVGFAPPAPGPVPFALHAGLAVDGATVRLQVAVRARDAVTPRRPVALTFVLDNSGSMAGEGIARERALLGAVAKKLVVGDVVSVLTWSLEDSILLRGHVWAGADDPALADVAKSLRAAGGSDLHAALQSAYAVAREERRPDRLNRVVLVSDGGANLGVTDASVIVDEAARADAGEIYLTGVGTGPAAGYSDRLMNQLTDAGRGAYVYLDSDEEAARMFGERFDEVMSIAARSVQVSVTVPWYLEMKSFYGEGYSPNPEDIVPQHLAPGGEMIFDHVLASCDPAQIADGDLVHATVAWHVDRDEGETQTTEQAWSIADLRQSGERERRKGAAIIAYAEALKLDGAKAHDALVAAHATITELLDRPDLAGDRELVEIRDLVAAHPAFAAPKP